MLFSRFIVACAAVSCLVACGSRESSSGTGPTPFQPDLPPAPKPRKDIELEHYGKISEFGGTTNAALFVLKPESGKLTITSVVGPQFIKSYQVGILTPAAVTKLFNKVPRPLNEREKQELAKLEGGTAIYAEGYEGRLCAENETKYEITATGQLDETDVAVTFLIQALPSPNGECVFQTFGIMTQYVN